MKTFILNVSRYKKWITLGLSILYLLLFCFPLITMGKFDNSTNEVIAYELPFILYLAQFVINFPQGIKSLSQIKGEIHPITLRNFSISITCAILMLACFILAVVCLVRVFKGKKFYFVWSIALGFLTMLIKGIPADTNLGYSFYPTTAIFLILLILDVVYLILERYYLRPDYDQRLAKRKVAKQAKQDAQLKQSPEYRIEQLEKELQELKAKNDDKDGQ